MDIKFMVYTLKNTVIGDISVVFSNELNFYIKRIFLSDYKSSSLDKAYDSFSNLVEVNYNDLNIYLQGFVSKIRDYLNGKNVNFSLEHLDLSGLTEFQRTVLLNEFKFHGRNKVNTYKELAELSGSPRAYRAVGNTLANNPFPIVIPCHKTVKSDHSIGGFNGFQAGLQAKATLLKLDGIFVDERKVVSKSPIVSYDKNNQSKFLDDSGIINIPKARVKEKNHDGNYRQLKLVNTDESNSKKDNKNFNNNDKSNTVLMDFKTEKCIKSRLIDEDSIESEEFETNDLN